MRGRVFNFLEVVVIEYSTAPAEKLKGCDARTKMLVMDRSHFLIDVTHTRTKGLTLVREVPMLEVASSGVLYFFNL